MKHWSFLLTTPFLGNTHLPVPTTFFKGGKSDAIGDQQCHITHISDGSNVDDNQDKHAGILSECMQAWLDG